MPSRSDLLVGIVALVALSTPALPAHAAAYQSDVVLVDDTVAEDLYAIGGRVEVSGRVEGDLLVAAADEVRITGTVEGSVTALAPRVVVSGVVGGSLRAVAGSVAVTGAVGADVVAAAGTLDVAGRTGRDVLAWVNRAAVEGTVARDVRGTLRRLVLDGAVRGTVEVSTASLSVGEDARVDGYLAYRSAEEATVADGARVAGSAIHRRPLRPNVTVEGLGLLVGWLGTTAALVFGLVLTWAAFSSAVAAAEEVRRRPVAAVAWGVGAVSVVLAPVAVVTGALAAGAPTASLALLAVGLPVLVIVAILAVVGLGASLVPTGAAVGGLVAGRASPYGRFLVGAIVVRVMWLVPVVGAPLVAVALLGGLGGWVLAFGRARGQRSAIASTT